MASRAAWRARPDDPRTFIGWLVRDGRGATRFVAARLMWILGAGAIGAFFSGHFMPAAVLCGLASLPDAFLDDRSSRSPSPYLPRPRPLPVGDLVTLPPLATPFPCRLEMLKDGTLLGIDVGVVTFIEGWLHYEGHRTSFSLRRNDIARRSGSSLTLAEGGEARFGPHDLLVAGEYTEAGLSARFRANLASWMRSDPPSGESLLPPASVHMTGLVRARTNIATMSILGGGLIVLAAFHASHAWAWVVTLSFGLGLALALRDLRRVRRSLADRRA